MAAFLPTSATTEAVQSPIESSLTSLFEKTDRTSSGYGDVDRLIRYDEAAPSEVPKLKKLSEREVAA